MKTPTPPLCQSTEPGDKAEKRHPGVAVPMNRHGLRSSAQRWRCPICGATAAGRVASRGLHSSKRLSLQSIATRVVGAMDEKTIADEVRLPLSVVRDRMEKISQAAQAQNMIHPPGTGAGWLWVPLPSPFDVGVIAIGLGRSRGQASKTKWRVLALEQQSLRSAIKALKVEFKGRVRPAEQFPQNGGRERRNDVRDWLAKVLAPAKTVDEASTRLWILLARSNAWDLEADVSSLVRPSNQDADESPP